MSRRGKSIDVGQDGYGRMMLLELLEETTGKNYGKTIIVLYKTVIRQLHHGVVTEMLDYCIRDKKGGEL